MLPKDTFDPNELVILTIVFVTLILVFISLFFLTKKDELSDPILTACYLAIILIICVFLVFLILEILLYYALYIQETEILPPPLIPVI